MNNNNINNNNNNSNYPGEHDTFFAPPPEGRELKCEQWCTCMRFLTLQQYLSVVLVYAVSICSASLLYM